MATQDHFMLRLAAVRRPAAFATALTFFIAAISGCEKPANSTGANTSGTASGTVRRLVFLTNGDDPFWDTCRAGMDAAAAELKLKDEGLVQVMDKGSEFKAEKQLAKLEQLATQSDVAAVAVSPVDAKNRAFAQALRNLRDRGVHVICVDSDVDREKYRDARFAYLGTDNLIGGQELGKAARGLRPDGGKYATFVGVKTVANAIERIKGFGEGAGEKFKDLDSMADEGDDNRAQENVKTVLNKHKDVDTLVGIWAYNAHAIVRVVEERGVRDKTTVVVFDAAARALADMSQGQIDAMVVQNPYQMGDLSVKLMRALTKKDGAAIQKVLPSYDPETGKFKEPDGDVFHTELRVVVPNKESPLKPDLFRPETKFFYFEDFKKWLDERHLVSS